MRDTVQESGKQTNKYALRRGCYSHWETREIQPNFWIKKICAHVAAHERCRDITSV